MQNFETHKSHVCILKIAMVEIFFQLAVSVPRETYKI
jgi:hypothetical protein